MNFIIKLGKVQDSITIMREAAQWLIDIDQPNWNLVDITIEKMVTQNPEENLVVGMGRS
jgi:hypothetical protein